MADKIVITDGESIKGIDLPQYPASAWNWYSGEPDPNTDKDPYAKEYYSRVAAVYRAANINATIISSIPFALVKENGDDYDVSDDWQNKVGFLPNPRELLRLWRLSLFMTNSAYAFREGPRNFTMMNKLRWIRPLNIEPIINARDGLVGFKRSVNNYTETYKVQSNGWCRIFYMHWLDHTTEVAPSKNTEFIALMNAAGVLFHSDEHIKHFFSRGGIKPTLLLVKGIATKEDREKMESVWTKIITGAYKWLGKVFNGDAVEPKLIGDGIDNLKESNIHSNALEDIAMASGMPLSLLLANSANYATAQQEYATWFNNEVVPRADWIAEQLNEQIFRPMGLHWEFRDEVTNEGTEEEERRAGAFSALVASNVYPSVASQMLGYELPPDYTDYSKLDDDYFEMMQRKAEIMALNNPMNNAELAPKEPKITEPKPPRDKVNPDVARTDKSIVTFTMPQFAEAKIWHDIAQRKLKRNDELQFPFVCKELDEDTASAIRKNLAECKTEDDIEQTFDLNNYNGVKRNDSGLLEVAKALDKAAEALMGGNMKPDVQQGESKDDFMRRCIPKVIEDGTAESNDQAVAICSSMWDDKNKEK